MISLLNCLLFVSSHQCTLVWRQRFRPPVPCCVSQRRAMLVTEKPLVTELGSKWMKLYMWWSYHAFQNISMLYKLNVSTTHLPMQVDVRDVNSVPGSGRCPGGGHGNPLQYSCLENSMDKEAWWAMVHSVAKSRTWLRRLSMHAHVTVLIYSITITC